MLMLMMMMILLPPDRPQIEMMFLLGRGALGVEPGTRLEPA
jgi:hypothetical protein